MKELIILIIIGITFGLSIEAGEILALYVSGTPGFLLSGLVGFGFGYTGYKLIERLL